ncbi:MAG: prepilin-type N-terminal cleavage/methylation domain-containing protein [Mariprofundaceae bacterium]
MIDLKHIMRTERDNKEKGFTLIELMIVVAIIGILAAIAIPQFAAYRVRAFNSASESDLRNLKLAEEALFADTQQYGTVVAKDATGAAGPGALASAVAAPWFIATSDNDGTVVEQVQAGFSTNVDAITSTDAGEASFTAFTGHLQGDRVYGIDSDATAIYWASKDAGTVFADPGIASIVNADDVDTVASGQTTGGPQATFTIL